MAKKQAITSIRQLVSDDEVRAASGKLERLLDFVGRENPVNDTFIRFMLEEAAMVRAGMKQPAIRRLAYSNAASDQ